MVSSELSGPGSVLVGYVTRTALFSPGPNSKLLCVNLRCVYIIYKQMQSYATTLM